MSGDGTYAPKSPDLSSFYSAGPTRPPPQSVPGAQPQQHRQRPLSQQSQTQFSPHQRLQLQPSSTYFPASPASVSSQRPQSQHHHQQQPAQQAQLQIAPHTVATPTQPAPDTALLYSPYFPRPPAAAQSPGQTISQAGPRYSPLTPQQPFYQSYGSAQYQQQFSGAAQEFTASHGLSFFHTPPAQSATSAAPLGSGQIGHSDTDRHSPSGVMPKRAAAQSSQMAAAAIEPSPVKTKFPTARIKRIMQADEEVGKVAQQTPIAVGKALELFMVALVTKSADVAREKNSKRVSAQMLKHVVESDDQWDFLREIVGRVENEEKTGQSAGNKGGAGARSTKAESESEEEVVEKKKTRTGRKRRAAA